MLGRERTWRWIPAVLLALVVALGAGAAAVDAGAERGSPRDPVRPPAALTAGLFGAAQIAGDLRPALRIADPRGGGRLLLMLAAVCVLLCALAGPCWWSRAVSARPLLRPLSGALAARGRAPPHPAG